MAQKVNYIVQDSDALLMAINHHRSAMNEKRFSAATYTAFTNAQENLRAKEVAQQLAVKTYDEKTAAQKFYIDELNRLIKVLRNAVKSAYDENEQKLSLFRVKDPIPQTVKALRPMCEYLVRVTADDTLILENGITAAEVAGIGTNLALLITADAVQENAMQLQVGATKVRDAASKAVKKFCRTIRNFANACFSESPEILVECKPIRRGRGGKGGGGGEDETPPDNPTPPPAQ